MPEFVCASVREMTHYADKLGAELERGVTDLLDVEKQAVAAYIAGQPDLQGFTDLYRVSYHTYRIFQPGSGKEEFIHAALIPDYASIGYRADQAVQIGRIYVSRHDHTKMFLQSPDLAERKKP